MKKIFLLILFLFFADGFSQANKRTVSIPVSGSRLTWPSISCGVEDKTLSSATLLSRLYNGYDMNAQPIYEVRASFAIYNSSSFETNYNMQCSCSMNELFYDYLGNPGSKAISVSCEGNSRGISNCMKNYYDCSCSGSCEFTFSAPVECQYKESDRAGLESECLANGGTPRFNAVNQDGCLTGTCEDGCNKAFFDAEYATGAAADCCALGKKVKDKNSLTCMYRSPTSTDGFVYGQFLQQGDALCSDAPNPDSYCGMEYDDNSSSSGAEEGGSSSSGSGDNGSSSSGSGGDGSSSSGTGRGHSTNSGNSSDSGSSSDSGNNSSDSGGSSSDSSGNSSGSGDGASSDSGVPGDEPPDGDLTGKSSGSGAGPDVMPPGGRPGGDFVKDSSDIDQLDSAGKVSCKSLKNCDWSTQIGQELQIKIEKAVHDTIVSFWNWLEYKRWEDSLLLSANWKTEGSFRDSQQYFMDTIEGLMFKHYGRQDSLGAATIRQLNSMDSLNGLYYQSNLSGQMDVKNSLDTLRSKLLSELGDGTEETVGAIERLITTLAEKGTGTDMSGVVEGLGGVNASVNDLGKRLEDALSDGNGKILSALDSLTGDCVGDYCGDGNYSSIGDGDGGLGGLDSLSRNGISRAGYDSLLSVPGLGGLQGTADSLTGAIRAATATPFVSGMACPAEELSVDACTVFGDSCKRSLCDDMFYIKGKHFVEWIGVIFEFVAWVLFLVRIA